MLDDGKVCFSKEKGFIVFSLWNAWSTWRTWSAPAVKASNLDIHASKDEIWREIRAADPGCRRSVIRRTDVHKTNKQNKAKEKNTNTKTNTHSGVVHRFVYRFICTRTYRWSSNDLAGFFGFWICFLTEFWTEFVNWVQDWISDWISDWILGSNCGLSLGLNTGIEY